MPAHLRGYLDHGPDRALAVSCYDGAGPRFLGVISEKFGTPVRVNIFSGIVASLVVVLGNLLTSGNASKYFAAVLAVTISTTLISYIAIYPAAWRLRRSHPGTPRPYRAPLVGPLTVILVVLIVFASVQLIAPGLGDGWFNDNVTPSGWTYSERTAYLFTELIPVLVFVAVGILFWALGKPTREQLIPVAPVPVEVTEA